MSFVGVALEEALKEGAGLFQVVYLQIPAFSAGFSRIASPAFK